MDDSTRSLDATGGGQAQPRTTPELAIGDTFGRYQVRRLLGRGGMGQVYLARDITLGRSVALKIITDAGDANRFLDEARAIARLNHPNIVQLYDFETYRKGLVLALEYVDGVTLKERAEDALELDEILRHLRAIADALAHAHASEVLHCDLKPSNVMIGRDGRVRVVDFGLAQVGTQQRGGGGTPDWMAPEQWLGSALTDRVDIWALGLIAAMLIARTHPLGENVELRRRAVIDPERDATFACARTDVPATIVERITQSLDYAPTARPSASDWLRTLDEALTGRDELVEDGPYPGLTAFGERHARLYFGREPEIDELLERLRDAPVLPIVGPSGAGKSSFLHAGVIPRLRKRGRWHVLTFRPGHDPIGALARQLVIAGGNASRETAASLRDELVATPTLLAARLTTLALALDASLLVAIDQLEEVFTQGAPEDEQLAFVRMLLEAADDSHDPFRLMFTVRDDFVGRLPGVRALFVMHPLDEAALRRTVTAPLARYRYGIDDPTLVDDLMTEVASTGAAALPLLQFTCRALWEGRDVEARTLRRATYREIGGVAGALARHAQRAIASMPVAEQALARKVLLRLVAGQTRRTVARDDLIATLGSASSAVLDRLLESRLLVQRTDEERATVEIAHEALLQTWDQLARWIDESREERRLLDDLDAAAIHWERRGSRIDETWARDELVGARQRIKQLEVAVPPRVEEFLAAGEARDHAAARRRRIRGGIVIGVLAVLAVVVGGAISRFLAREERIRTNLGTLDLVVTMFDRTAAGSVAVPPGELVWTIHGASPDLNEPGAVFSDQLASVERTGDGIRVSAPGGVVFLAVSNRGKRGETCAPSWIRIQSFPGYAAQRQRLAIEVPTCQATRFGMADIPAGEFIYGGPGDPPSKQYGVPDFTLPEQTRSLPRFAMDRTEVSNRAYEPFAKLAAITGYPAPTYSVEPLLAHGDDPESPVTSVDSYAARAYCRYLGKDLPSDPQWVKAARGGLVIDGVPNPAPRRLYPWVGAMRPECVNDNGDEDGWFWVAPVDAFACGASPYGILNLVGNVQEWIAKRDGPDPDNPLHIQRGGGVDAPAEMELTTTLFVNRRLPRDFTYSTGFRCVDNEGGQHGL